MLQDSREQRILKQISSLKKSAKKKAKRVAPRSKVKTSAENKKTMMLSILDNENLKAGDKLTKVFAILQDEK